MYHYSHTRRSFPLSQISAAWQAFLAGAAALAQPEVVAATPRELGPGDPIAAILAACLAGAAAVRAANEADPDSGQMVLQAGYDITIQPGHLSVRFGSGRSRMQIYVSPRDIEITAGVESGADDDQLEAARESVEARWAAAMASL